MCGLLQCSCTWPSQQLRGRLEPELWYTQAEQHLAGYTKGRMEIILYAQLFSLR